MYKISEVKRLCLVVAKSINCGIDIDLLIKRTDFLNNTVPVKKYQGIAAQAGLHSNTSGWRIGRAKGKPMENTKRIGAIENDIFMDLLFLGSLNLGFQKKRQTANPAIK